MITLTGFFIILSCSLIGIYLNLRRMSLVGDAVSHSLLPGLFVAFYFWGRSAPLALLAGAFLTSVFVLLSLGWMSRVTRVKSDAVQTLLYSSFFAAGILLVSLGSSRVDLDAECVLFGEMAFLPLRPAWILFGKSFPQSTVILGVVTLVTIAGVVLCFKTLLLTTFDENFSLVNGQRVRAVKMGLLLWLSVVVAAAFESVGAVLVVGMLILPGATLLLIPWSLRRLLWLLPLYAIVISYVGVELAFRWDSSIGATMVFIAFVIFLLSVVIRYLRKKNDLRVAKDPLQTLSMPQK